MTMKRRAFVRAAGPRTGRGHRAARQCRRKPAAERALKKAFMLGGLSKGDPRPAFRAPERGRLRRRRADQPQQARPRRGPRAHDETGLVIHGVSGSATGRIRSPTPTRRSSSAAWRRSAGIRRTARPTVARPSWSYRPSSPARSRYRDAYKRSQANIRKLIPDAEASGVKIAIEEVWNKFLSARSSSPATSTSSRAPGLAPTSTSATSSSSAIPRSGFASSPSESSRSTSRNTPRTNGSTTPSARAKSTGRRSARRWSMSATAAGSPQKSRMGRPRGNERCSRPNEAATRSR